MELIKPYSGTIIHILFLSVTTLHFLMEKKYGNDLSDFLPDLATLARAALMEFLMTFLQPKEIIYIVNIKKDLDSESST